MRENLIGLDLVGRAAAHAARAARGNKADLLTGRRKARARRRSAQVLVVTTTVRVVDGVHGDTAHLRPLVALGGVLVVRAAGLQHRLLSAAAAGNDTDLQ